MLAKIYSANVPGSWNQLFLIVILTLLTGPKFLVADETNPTTAALQPLDMPFGGDQFAAPDYEKRMDNAEKSIPAVREFKKIYPNAKVMRHIAIAGDVGFLRDYCVIVVRAPLYERYLVEMMVKFQVGPDHVAITRIEPPSISVSNVARIDLRPDGRPSQVIYEPAKERHQDAISWDVLKQHGGDLAAIGYEVDKNRPVPHFDVLWDGMGGH